ncbi:Beta-glucosidase 24 [Linum perenne]
MNAYRFSVSWSRVLPISDRKVNEKGIKYYNNVINEAISQGLTPFLTLFHLDLPQALQDEYGGFLSNHIVNDFRDFADLCFREFGNRVKHWITLNEPGTFLSSGYVVGDLAPGREGKSDVEPYIVCHNMLLAHATAVELYRRKYQTSQSGVIGVAVNADWLIPYNASNALDHKAAQRAYDFNLGWFLDPMVRGEYPSSMKYYVGD